MNYRRFKKIIVSIALMCVFAIPMAVTVTPPVYAQQSGVTSDLAQWRRYGYRGYRPVYRRPYYRPYYRHYGYRPWVYGGYRRPWVYGGYRPYRHGYYVRPRFRYGFYF
jgi:hypothetical protein